MSVIVNYRPTHIEYRCISVDAEALIKEALKAKPNDRVLVGNGVIIIERPRRPRR